MIAVDTNILVYSHRRESRFHEQAFDLMKGLAEGTEKWAIPWPCLYEFFSVVTNPRIWKDATTPSEQAGAQISAWTNAPGVTLLNETKDFESVLVPLITQPRVKGPIVHDARIAALCIAHGIDELLSKDRDFQLFGEITTRDPLV
ncbi:MAG: PIN domain-containing protein [Proteobacteria bacterium]|nr:PIN domain-containing protein [Pseudomonadota bacterium]MDA1299053.1 PIN domain-containing protein [Pseudomonadota bacterium]